MRRLLGTLALILAACGGGDDKKDKAAPPTQSTVIEPRYEDFSLRLSENGQYAAFLSRRDDGAYRAYLYKEGREPSLQRFADLLPLGEGEDEQAVALSPDGAWLLVYRSGPSASHVVLSPFSGQLQTSVALQAGERVVDMAFAAVATPYFALSKRGSASEGVSIYTYSQSENVLTATLMNHFDGESQPRFVKDNTGTVYLFTTSSDSSNTLIKLRKLLNSAWIETGDPLTLSAQDSIRSSASSRGLFYVQGLSSSRLKDKLGSIKTWPEGAVKQVGVQEEVAQYEPFSSSPLDFQAASYRRYEPLTIAQISATQDGSYLLIAGTDSYTCEDRPQEALRLNTWLLIRSSDMAVLPLFLVRTKADKVWNELVTDPCFIIDDEALVASKEFDTAVAASHLVAGDGSTFRLMYESLASGDRELRQLSFRVDNWDIATLSQVSITDISANPRP